MHRRIKAYQVKVGDKVFLGGEAHPVEKIVTEGGGGFSITLLTPDGPKAYYYPTYFDITVVAKSARLVPRSVLQQYPLVDSVDPSERAKSLNTQLVVVEEIEEYIPKVSIVVEKRDLR